MFYYSNFKIFHCVLYTDKLASKICTGIYALHQRRNGGYYCIKLKVPICRNFMQMCL